VIIKGEKAMRKKPNRAAAAGIAALDIAIKNAGGQGIFALHLGLTSATVSHWRVRFYVIPLEWVPAIVAIANDPRVTPYTLRPDYAPQWVMLAEQLAACHTEVVRAAIEKNAATVDNEEQVEA
jgi:DNA-binding transcriptional regulator YdaS (Cro superfamily)